MPNSIADDVLAKSGGKRAPMASAVIALLVAGGLFVGSAQDARAEDHGASPPGAEVVVLRPRSASSIAAHCSAA